MPQQLSSLEDAGFFPISLKSLTAYTNVTEPTSTIFRSTFNPFDVIKHMWENPIIYFMRIDGRDSFHKTKSKLALTGPGTRGYTKMCISGGGAPP